MSALTLAQARRALEFAKAFDHGWYYTRANPETTDEELATCLVAGKPLPLAPPCEQFGRVEPPQAKPNGVVTHTTGSESLRWTITPSGGGGCTVGGAGGEPPVARVAWSATGRVQLHLAGCFRYLTWTGQDWEWGGDINPRLRFGPSPSPWPQWEGNFHFAMHWRDRLARLWRALGVPEPGVLEVKAPKPLPEPGWKVVDSYVVEGVEVDVLAKGGAQ